MWPKVSTKLEYIFPDPDIRGFQSRGSAMQNCFQGRVRGGWEFYNWRKSVYNKSGAFSFASYSQDVISLNTPRIRDWRKRVKMSHFESARACRDPTLYGTYDLGKKTVSPSGVNILVKSQPILENYMRYGSAKEFPPI